jgi:uncharacterized protein (DUF305 family)
MHSTFTKSGINGAGVESRRERREIMKTMLAGMALGVALGAAGIAIAQGGHHHGHSSPAAPAAASASAKAFQAANAKMHKAMDIRFTGDADADFVRGMIPHHEGAVDMARIVLAHGKDPEIRRLAEEVLKAQETEIGQMKAWLKKRGL